MDNFQDEEMYDVEWGGCIGAYQDNEEIHYMQSLREMVNENTQQQTNWDEFIELYQEASRMILDRVQPSEGWYDLQFKYIYKYYMIDWENLADKFAGKDNILYELAIKTREIIQGLMDEYGGQPNFSFNNYYTMLCNIYNLWIYYKDKYIGEEDDSDVVDLVEMMSFL